MTGGTNLGDGGGDIGDREGGATSLTGVRWIVDQRERDGVRVEFRPHVMHRVVGVVGWDDDAEDVAVEGEGSLHVGHVDGHKVDGADIHGGGPFWEGATRRLSGGAILALVQDEGIAVEVAHGGHVADRGVDWFEDDVATGGAEHLGGRGDVVVVDAGEVDGDAGRKIKARRGANSVRRAGGAGA